MEEMISLGVCFEFGTIVGTAGLRLCIQTARLSSAQLFLLLFRPLTYSKMGKKQSMFFLHNQFDHDSSSACL